MSYTDEDARLVARAIQLADWRLAVEDHIYGHDEPVPDLDELEENERTEYEVEARAALDALAEAGRLLPPDTYTEEEYQHGTEI